MNDYTYQCAWDFEKHKGLMFFYENGKVIEVQEVPECESLEEFREFMKDIKNILKEDKRGRWKYEN